MFSAYITYLHCRMFLAAVFTQSFPSHEFCISENGATEGPVDQQQGIFSAYRMSQVQPLAVKKKFELKDWQRAWRFAAKAFRDYWAWWTNGLNKNKVASCFYVSISQGPEHSGWAPSLNATGSNFFNTCQYLWGGIVPGISNWEDQIAGKEKDSFLKLENCCPSAKILLS